MKKIISSSLLLIIFYSINAQNKWFIRSDFGLNRAIVNSNLDNLTGEFKPHNRIIYGYDAIIGIYLGHSIYKNLNIELGVNYQAFSNRYSLTYDSFGSAGCFGSSKNAFLIIPLNVYYYFNIPKTRFTFTPHLGLSHASHLHKDYFRTDITIDNMGSSDNFEITNETDTLTTFTTRPTNNYSFLFNAGAGFEYRILQRLSITINGNYSFGYKEINRFVVLLKREDSNNINGNLDYKGTHYYLTCGLKIYI